MLIVKESVFAVVLRKEFENLLYSGDVSNQQGNHNRKEDAGRIETIISENHDEKIFSVSQQTGAKHREESFCVERC